ncbi:MAG: butyrate kinase [Oscillospiraceae bacterium]|jgi:butyrate kinase|nr:butyrate kinase [Oscillospiraceae bacterium]
MGERIRVLAVNTGSTSTKIALFDDYDELFRKTIRHSVDDLKDFYEIQDQLSYRAETVEKAVAEKGYDLAGVDVFSGRGGGVLAVQGGVYSVSNLLAFHASIGMAGQHPAQLAPQIVKQFADRFGKLAFVVNPPDVDEFCEIARVSGIKGIYRESHIHALNQKEIAKRFCELKEQKYDQVNLVICHLGGGVSITAHEKGRMIDSNDIIGGSGPMSPTRAGDLPYMKVLELAFSDRYSRKELIDKLNQDGGLVDHFGTADIRDVLKMVDDGDINAKIIIDGMIYQCAKYVGAMAVALKGKVDAVILTGGLAFSEYFADMMKEHVNWIAETVVMPGDYELEALAAGAIRVLRGEETLKEYTGVPIWNGLGG